MFDLTLTPEQSARLLSSVEQANSEFAAKYPGVALARQPVHTLYGGAQLYKPGAALKLGRLARDHFDTYAPSPEKLAEVLEIELDMAGRIFARIRDKLEREPIEDHRIDFEDGYGARADAEEDGHVETSAAALMEGMASDELPSGIGIRIKALTEEAKARSLRTLDLFLTTVIRGAGRLPDGFSVTLPKVTSTAQVGLLADALDHIETAFDLPKNSIRIEVMIETIQSILGASGEIAIPGLIRAGRGRVSTAVLGTFDYTASCNIASTWQDHMHPAVDFARHMMQISLTGTEVALCDGITNVMPIGPHRGADLTVEQIRDNEQVVHAAWREHYRNIQHSLRLGFYQGWDLHAGQIPMRYAAVYSFFLAGLNDATERLRVFVDRAAQASLVGNTFDDAATGQGLVNYFVSGINCGALSEEDLTGTGITADELKGRSFLKIVERRSTESRT